MARFYNRGWRRSWYRRGSTAKRGTTTFTCRIPLEDVVQFTIPATVDASSPHYWSNLVCTSPYAQFTTDNVLKDLSKGSLMNSYLYRTYTRIYDQVKVNAVSVSIGLMEGIGGANQLAALRLYTNWDRDYKFEELVSKNPTTPEELGTGSESQSYLMVNNSKQTLKRYVAARDIQEKTTYHDCSYTFHQKKTNGAGTVVYNEGYYGDDAWAPLVEGYNRGDGGQTVAYGHSSAIGFVPTLMMAVWSPSTFAADRVIPVSLKVTYSVTFRMPKFGLSSGSVGAKFTEMRSDAVEDVKAEIEEEKKSEEEKQSEEPVLKKKKVVYEEEMIPDDEPEEEDSEDQTPLTQPFKNPVKKAGKKSSS